MLVLIWEQEGNRNTTAGNAFNPGRGLKVLQTWLGHSTRLTIANVLENVKQVVALGPPWRSGALAAGLEPASQSFPSA
jgi:hypothetical protein